MGEALLSETARQVREWMAAGRVAVTARVVAIRGFSTWPGDELLALCDDGRQAGRLLGEAGASQVLGPARQLLDAADPLGRTVTVGIHGRAVREAGLSCGGEAEVRLDFASALPPTWWAALEERIPVALVSGAEGGGLAAVTAGGTAMAGADAGTAAMPDPARQRAFTLAGQAGLAGGHSGVRVMDSPAGPLRIEVWAPPPRLVVAGTGELLDALGEQSRLLGWQVRAIDSAAECEQALAWAGSTAAVVVLTHDPYLDVQVMAAALASGAVYVGAMGSSGTQSRRRDRLLAEGVPEAAIDTVHRPIGLDIGARSPAEMALAICAEIMASRTGRSGGSLRGHTGPIRGLRPHSG